MIYSLFFPLKWRSSKAMKKAQKLAPKMKELQEKIKGMKQKDPRLKVQRFAGTFDEADDDVIASVALQLALLLVIQRPESNEYP